MIGILEPSNPAAVKLIIIAAVKTRLKFKSEKGIYIINDPIIARAKPFNNQTNISFKITFVMYICFISLLANALTVTVIAWVPALPPILATIGIMVARAINFSMASLNWLITREVAQAVIKLINNQGNLCFTVAYRLSNISLVLIPPRCENSLSVCSSIM